MNRYLQQAAAHIEAMSLRERILVLAAVVVALYSVWDMLVMMPVNDRYQQLENRMSMLGSQAQEQVRQSRQLAEDALVDPSRGSQRRLQELLQQRNALQEKLDAMTVGLIDPTQMAKVLEDMFTRDGNLKLLRMESLESKPLLRGDTGEDDEDAAIAAANPQGPDLYQHGLVVEFEGSYLDTLSYLRAIEALPWRIYWDHLRYEVAEYPTARVSVTVHTLSLGSGWLGV